MNSFCVLALLDFLIKALSRQCCNFLNVILDILQNRNGNALKWLIWQYLLEKLTFLLKFKLKSIFRFPVCKMPQNNFSVLICRLQLLLNQVYLLVHLKKNSKSKTTSEIRSCSLSKHLLPIQSHSSKLWTLNYETNKTFDRLTSNFSSKQFFYHPPK